MAETTLSVWSAVSRAEGSGTPRLRGRAERAESQWGRSRAASRCTVPRADGLREGPVLPQRGAHAADRDVGEAQPDGQLGGRHDLRVRPAHRGCGHGGIVAGKGVSPPVPLQPAPADLSEGQPGTGIRGRHP